LSLDLQASLFQEGVAAEMIFNVLESLHFALAAAIAPTGVSLDFGQVIQEA
jgi:hypothetical protein